MNIQQLKYIIEIERQGSISKAAHALFLSQPSLSNSIKELESELGTTIFLRNNNGIRLTKEGLEICKYAKSILQQFESIKNVANDKPILNFRLATENYSLVMESFVHMCVKYNAHPKLNFMIKNEDMLGVIDSVSRFDSDLGILLINSCSHELCTNTLLSRNIEFFKLQEIPVNVNLSKSHPLLQESPFPFKKLNEYMFVQYANEKNNIISYMPELKTLDIINPNKTISVIDRELKCNIVSQTTAFSIGCTLHPRFMSNFNIVTVPIPGNFATLGYIKIKNSFLSDEALSFIEILKQEVTTVLSQPT